VTITRVGTNAKYADGWDTAFSKKRATTASKKTAGKKTAKKASAKKSGKKAKR
jgi:hypothetical protein